MAPIGSTRLPGKVMVDMTGEPMLASVTNRVCQASKLDEAVVSTTTNPDDNLIVDLCEECDWLVFRCRQYGQTDSCYGEG